MNPSRRLTPLLSLAVSFLFFTERGTAAETLRTPRLTCEVTETAELTTLTAKTKGCDEPVVFRIDWKNGDTQAEGFKTSKAGDRAITSSHRLGKTTVTRTVLASTTADCILIHVIADQPGAISFTARFVSETWDRLGKKHDLGHTPPNPHLIWEGIKIR